MNLSQAGKMSGKKHALSLAFLILLIVVTFWFLLKDIGFTGLIKAVQKADPVYLLIGVGLVFVYFAGEGEAIRMITKSLGHSVTHRRGFVYACIDFYFSAITPSATGGQPVCIYYMNKDKIPVSVSSITLLLHTVVYKTILILLGFWVMFAKSTWFLGGNLSVKLLFILGIIINVITVVVCLLAMFSRRAIRKMAVWGIRVAGKIKLIKKPDEVTQKLLRSLETYANSAEYIRTHLFLVVRVFVVTLVQRIAMFAISYCVYKALGLARYDLFDMIALQTLIAMAIDSLPLPGGMGASEGVFTMLYRSVYGVKTLVPATVLTRGISYYFALVLSSICVIFNQSRIVRLEKNEKNESLQEEPSRS